MSLRCFWTNFSQRRVSTITRVASSSHFVELVFDGGDVKKGETFKSLQAQKTIQLIFAK